MRFRPLFQHFKEMKHYFIVVVLVFGFSLYLGWANSEQFSHFLEGQMQGLKSLSQSLSNKENPQLWFFIFIFLNNAIKSVVIIFLGLLLGILPLFMLIANGMILGYVLSLQTHESTLSIVLKGILPHGIIEIPVILIACAYGLKLGLLVWKSVAQLFVPDKDKTARTELVKILHLTKPLIVSIVVLLLVAAIIESTLTYWLVHL
ncbi:stage II sporulation protein M [Paenibacillus sp. V4I3]|uniref:stage II sporulation protein M n=1 Tax=unclassified Paenibacillus TaxID=185978 RepID=UPI0027831589|nr:MULTISPECIES: stage II sporulation protein M [unclassified Paenibacillus]MDQ0872670.1 stage II sporulation protein M [Paenibacillus sp. V4I3]MDQ0891446.1 stage II sporulation protein M [Paenibacillus sp. V4I9]